jgi:hypothetical protein
VIGRPEEGGKKDKLRKRKAKISENINYAVEKNEKHNNNNNYI